MSVPRSYALLGPAYLAALLAVDTQVGRHGQVALGLVTCVVLVAALVPLAPLARAQALGVVAFATVGEVTGSLVWGVYHYRLHNLPLFIPPAHGIVYLSGLALVGVVTAASARRRRRGRGGRVGARRSDGAAAARRRGRARRAAALLLPLALAGSRRVCRRLPRRRRARAVRDVDRDVAVGRRPSPALGIPDGNPPSGVASGYVFFDVMALLVAPWLVYAAGTLKPKRLSRSGAWRSSMRRIEPIGMISASGVSSRSRTT